MPLVPCSLTASVQSGAGPGGPASPPRLSTSILKEFEFFFSSSCCFPLCKSVQVAGGRSLPCHSLPLLPCSSLALCVGPAAPIKAPLCSAQDMREQGACFGEESSALFQRSSAGDICSCPQLLTQRRALGFDFRSGPGSGDAIGTPVTRGVAFNPQPLASWECGRVLFFFSPLFNFKWFPALIQASSKI